VRIGQDTPDNSYRIDVPSRSIDDDGNMKVLLIRHALATAETSGLPDEHRFLTARGRDTARRVGDRLRLEGVVVDTWLTSPLVRAVQTAELMAQVLGFEGEVLALPSLAPGLPVAVVAEHLSRRTGTVVAVGHEPTISALGAVLVGRPTFPQFRPAQVCLIEGGLPRWTLNPDKVELEPLLVA
jgi:phosphohistidine phosphatase